MTFEPPSQAGSVQATVAEAAPGTAVTAVGASGATGPGDPAEPITLRYGADCPVAACSAFQLPLAERLPWAVFSDSTPVNCMAGCPAPWAHVFRLCHSVAFAV